MAALQGKLGYEHLPVTDLGNQQHQVSMEVPGAFGMRVTCTYWRNDYSGPEVDPWRYQLDALKPENGKTHYPGPFSHSSEKGCLIAIYKYLVALNVIETPQNNSHLDTIDTEIVAKITADWLDRANGKPRVGDFVQYADGSFKRCCNDTGKGQQVTKAIERSYHAMRFGSVSYSGGLESDIPWAQLVEQKGKRLPGRFWFFHHNKSGGGRGVDFFMPCRVFSVIEAEAGE
ncbi:MAG: hypothetical protein ACPGUX_05495 [Halocynthiibacter sp.]